MNTNKLRNIADKIVENMEPKSYFDTSLKRTDPGKVISKLYKNLSFTDEDKELIDLIISLKIDSTITSIRMVMKEVMGEELKPIKEDIKKIKSEVELNGKNETR